jgi:hypothetical protein
MNLPKMNNPLLDLDSTAAAPDLDAIIRRERRRVRCWAAATVGLWIATAVYLFGLLWFYAIMIHPVINEFFTTDNVDPSAMKPRMEIIAKLLLAALYWPALLVLAGTCTLFFTPASRRATLRQIQAQLADISGQLREMIQRPQD